MIIARRVLGAALTGSRAVAAAVGMDAGLRAAVDAGSWLCAAHAGARGPQARVARSDAARLIDLDNLAVGRSHPPASPAASLRDAGPIRGAMAAGHPDRVTGVVGGICADAGVQVPRVDGSPDAANRALLPGRETVLSTGGGLAARALVEMAAGIRRVAAR